MESARFPDYSHLMNYKRHFFKTNKVGFVLGAMLLAALTEGAGNADGQSVGITITPPIVVVAPVVIQDDYVYYPTYGVYYNSRLHRYHYLRGDAWVVQPAPEGVSVEVLLASPSVNMDWHDSPERHHAEMVQKYPKNWKRDNSHQDRKDVVPDHDKKQPGQTGKPPH